ncbi:MAG TPA: GntR family transcriptional regulator [Trebonia sp.]|nr:GntR family transcriptional regulator [Trebonia sp.]
MGKSRYTEIVETLAGELADCQVGTRVASEHELAARFGVSRAAARSAIQELESQLLVRRVRGSGTFVNRPIDYVISADRPPSWHQTVRDAGATPRRLVREVRKAVLPQDLASRLGRPAGSPAHLLIRQGYINDLLSGWSQEWIPDDVFPDGADVAVHAVESVDLILRQMAKVEPVRAWCRVSMVIPPPDVAAGLEIDPGRQTWLVESVSRDAATGQPVMCSNTWTRTEMVRMIVELGAS